jgi:shikimate kinase
MNIVLVGYRCAGKTTVGRRLAARLNTRFVDTDELIESRCGCPIHDIVKVHGWDHFRRLEKLLIEEISKEDRLVIAPGGGAVLDNDNVAALRTNGLIIWLKADRGTILKRMDQDASAVFTRPTLTGRGTLQELDEMIFLRKPFYESASEIRIDTSSLDIESVVENIFTLLEKRMKIQFGSLHSLFDTLAR